MSDIRLEDTVQVHRGLAAKTLNVSHTAKSITNWASHVGQKEGNSTCVQNLRDGHLMAWVQEATV